MKTTVDELPTLESLPHSICRQCGRSLINGLFIPSELNRSEGPRCRKCSGELYAKQKLSKKEGF